MPSFAAESSSPNPGPTGAGDSDEPDGARLKRHQIISTNVPSQPPAVFDPDPNKLSLPTNAIGVSPGTLERVITVNSNPPALPPAAFNPDPGSHLLPAEPPPAEPFFRGTPGPSPRRLPPGPAPADALPRMNVRTGELRVVPPAPAGNHGYEPLPEGLELPREKVRRNLRIDQNFHVPHYSLSPESIPPHTEPRPDRWRIGFTPWKRYTSGVVEQPFESPEPRLWHPYRQSLLKGDLPVIGQDIFLNLTAMTQTDVEFRRVPTASGISAATSGAAEFFGESEQIGIQNNLAFSVELFRGETAFKPVEWAIRLEPVFNINYLNARETGVVSPDPRGFFGGNNGAPPDNSFVIHPSQIDQLLAGQVFPAGSFRGERHTVRTKDYFALQQAFAELHLHDLSENYDFFAVRAGTQPFNSDFRGFIFNDVNLGARVFGNYYNNVFQYNLSLFDMREKDTNSELNSFDSREQQVLIANFFWQDLIWKGYTAQVSFHANWDDGDRHYDENGVIVRPAPVGTVRDHSVSAYYLGWAGDGHIGRLNISHAFYQVFGHDEFNGIAGRPVDINAQMAAVEASYDRDWIRYKGSLFYASGDGDATDGTARGFDTILDNPNFTGGPFSYWTRQGFNLGGSAVNLKQRGSLVPNLRTSKTQGQANFVNPGVFIAGVGAEIELTPKLRSFVNANYIRLLDTDTIKTTLLTDEIGGEIGFDLSLGFQYRPLLTDNIILSTGFAALLPGRGFKDIYQTNTDPVPGFDPAGDAGEVDGFLYSALAAITFTY